MVTAEVRLAELVASLSLATDLGLGLPQEHVLRQTVIATRLARLAGRIPKRGFAEPSSPQLGLVGT